MNNNKLNMLGILLISFLICTLTPISALELSKQDVLHSEGVQLNNQYSNSVTTDNILKEDGQEQYNKNVERELNEERKFSAQLSPDYTSNYNPLLRLDPYNPSVPDNNSNNRNWFGTHPYLGATLIVAGAALGIAIGIATIWTTIVWCKYTRLYRERGSSSCLGCSRECASEWCCKCCPLTKRRVAEYIPEDEIIAQKKKTKRKNCERNKVSLAESEEYSSEGDSEALLLSVKDGVPSKMRIPLIGSLLKVKKGGLSQEDILELRAKFRSVNQLTPWDLYKMKDVTREIMKQPAGVEYSVSETIGLDGVTHSDWVKLINSDKKLKTEDIKQLYREGYTLFKWMFDTSTVHTTPPIIDPVTGHIRGIITIERELLQFNVRPNTVMAPVRILSDIWQFNVMDSDGVSQYVGTMRTWQLTTKQLTQGNPLLFGTFEPSNKFLRGGQAPVLGMGHNYEVLPGI